MKRAPTFRVNDFVQARTRAGTRFGTVVEVERRRSGQQLTIQGIGKGTLRVPASAVRLANPEEVKTLCAYCESEKTKSGWRKLTPAEYARLSKKASHGICPPCDKLERERIRAYAAKKNPYLGPVRGNEVWFTQYGKEHLGWIHQSTPSRYLIWFTRHGKPQTIWRSKSEVTFAGGPRKAVGRGNPKTAPAAKAKKLSAEFYGFAPRKKKRVPFRWPRELTQLGPAAEVEYLSDKFDGQWRQYYHKFEGRATLFADPEPQANGDRLLIIRFNGTITADGIEG